MKYTSQDIAGMEYSMSQVIAGMDHKSQDIAGMEYTSQDIAKRLKRDCRRAKSIWDFRSALDLPRLLL